MSRDAWALGHFARHVPLLQAQHMAAAAAERKDRKEEPASKTPKPSKTPRPKRAPPARAEDSENFAVIVQVRGARWAGGSGAPFHTALSLHTLTPGLYRPSHRRRRLCRLRVLVLQGRTGRR